MTTTRTTPGRCRSGVALVTAVLAGRMLASTATAQEIDFTGHAPIHVNAPGLECRQTDHPILAYESPSPSARPVSRITALMADSGTAWAYGCQLS